MQTMAVKTTTCNQYLFKHANSTLIIIKAVQSPLRFVILTPGFYNSGYSTGYNIAKATSFADILWYDLENLSCQDTRLQCPLKKRIFSREVFLRLQRLLCRQSWRSVVDTMTQYIYSTR